MLISLVNKLKNAELRAKGSGGYSHGMSLKQNSEMFEELYTVAAQSIIELNPSDELMSEIKKRIEKEIPGNEKRLSVILGTINHYVDKELNQRKI